MKNVYLALTVVLLVLMQGSFFTVFLPSVPINAALVFLALISFSVTRSQLLSNALLAGFVQDILYGEMIGLYMLTFFISAVVLWELKNDWLEERVYMCGLRLSVATLIQNLVIAFIFYMSSSGSLLLATLQYNAGMDLLANLALLVIILVLFRLRSKTALSALLGEKI